MFESRAVAVDHSVCQVKRGGFPVFRRATIGRRGPAGQSFREPELAHWAKVSQRMYEYRLYLAGKSLHMVASLGSVLQ
eukprot:774468-Pyramimonas_sp.AAC.1